jgi:hypothetical protein
MLSPRLPSPTPTPDDEDADFSREGKDENKEDSKSINKE